MKEKTRHREQTKLPLDVWNYVVRGSILVVAVVIVVVVVAAAAIEIIQCRAVIEHLEVAVGIIRVERVESRLEDLSQMRAGRKLVRRVRRRRRTRRRLMLVDGHLRLIDILLLRSGLLVFVLQFQWHLFPADTQFACNVAH